jgi:4-carboxymuconolactone decarboxylase
MRRLRRPFAFIGALLAPLAMAQERLPAVPPGSYTDAQKKVTTDIAAGPRAELFSPLQPMLRSPELAYTAERFGEYVYYHAALDKRIYELIVLLLARQLTQQFEWRVHYPLAMKAGIKQQDIDAIGAGRPPRHLAEDETIAYDFVTDLYTRDAVTDAHYPKFAEKFGERGVVDTVGLLGYYTTIALMMNVNRTPLPEGTAPLLKPRREGQK